MEDQWLSREEAVAVIRARVGRSIGYVQSIFESAIVSGEVRQRKPEDPILLIADDGLMSMDMRPGALRSSGTGVSRVLTPANEPTTSRDDLIDWLDRHHAASSTGKPGERAITKIEAAERGVAACYPGGLPSSISNATLARTVGKYLKKNYAGLGEISDDTIERGAGRKK